jgi:hypothetical protein
MSQVMPPTSNVLVGYGPNPRDMVQIQGGTTYSVPPGHLLVITALGSGQPLPSSSVRLLVNGSSQLEASISGVNVDTPSMRPVPSGCAIPAGAIVSLIETYGGTSPPILQAWGYLAPQ